MYFKKLKNSMVTMSLEYYQQKYTFLKNQKEILELEGTITKITLTSRA